jgi:LysM repeat protein
MKCSIDNISFSLMNSTMIELRVVLSAMSEVWKQAEKKVVTSIQEVEGISLDPSRIPAVTIYIVQKGDSLWSIAKRYNTTVDSLAKMNNIENPSKIQPGMQIMILKSVRVG